MMETHVAVNRWHINMDTIKCVSVRVCYRNVRTSNTYKCVTSPGLYRCRQGPIWQNDMVKWCHKFATSAQFHVGCKNKTNETALEIVGENGKNSKQLLSGNSYTENILRKFVRTMYCINKSKSHTIWVECEIHSRWILMVSMMSFCLYLYMYAWSGCICLLKHTTFKWDAFK